MKDKRVVITGGSSGMGKETVKKFLKEGSKVVFTDLNSDLAAELLQSHEKEVQEGRLFFKQGNVSVEKDTIALAKFTDEKLGGCDVLINNAGIFRGGQVHEMDEMDWDLNFNVNVKSIFFSAKYFIPQMLEGKSGAIVNTASNSGLLGEYNMAAYASSKGAICNLTRAMALDYADCGIRVNSVCPGATATPMFMTGSTEQVIQSFNKAFPPRRICKPEEVAEAIYFLASDNASFINGVNLPVDGGITAHTGQPRQDKDEE